MPGVWARTSLITTSAPPGISVKCTFVVSPRGNARKRAGQAQHAYPWPRDGLVPRVRSSMERVRAGEGDPDRAGGTPATARSLILSSHSGEWRVRSNAAPRDGEFSRAHGHIST